MNNLPITALRVSSTVFSPPIASPVIISSDYYSPEKAIIRELQKNRNTEKETSEYQKDRIQLLLMALALVPQAKHLLFGPHIDSDGNIAYGNIKLILKGGQYELVDDHNDLHLVVFEPFTVVKFDGIYHRYYDGFNEDDLSPFLIFFAMVHSIDLKSNDSLPHLKRVLKMAKPTLNSHELKVFYTLSFFPLRVQHGPRNLFVTPGKPIPNSGPTPLVLTPSLQNESTVDFIQPCGAISQACKIQDTKDSVAIIPVEAKRRKNSKQVYLVAGEPKPYIWQANRLTSETEKDIYVFSDLPAAIIFQNCKPDVICTAFIGGKDIILRIDWSLLADRNVVLVATCRPNEDRNTQYGLIQSVAEVIESIVADLMFEDYTEELT